MGGITTFATPNLSNLHIAEDPPPAKTLLFQDTKESLREAKTDSCEIKTSINREGQFLIFTAAGFNSQRETEGIKPLFSLLDLTENKVLLSDVNMQENQSGGIYTYYLNGKLQQHSYLIKTWFDANCMRTNSFKIEGEQ